MRCTKLSFVSGLALGALPIAISCLSTTANAADTSVTLNATILKRAAAKLVAECRRDGGTPGDMRQAITSADLTGDGLVEWFIDTDKYRCDGSEAMAGDYGNGGWPADIESGQPDGSSRQVFDATTFGMKLERSGKRPVVWVQVGGRYCGQGAMASRAEAWSCELPLQWNAAKRQLEIAPPRFARNLKK